MRGLCVRRSQCTKEMLGTRGSQRLTIPPRQIQNGTKNMSLHKILCLEDRVELHTAAKHQ